MCFIGLFFFENEGKKGVRSMQIDKDVIDIISLIVPTFIIIEHTSSNHPQKTIKSIFGTHFVGSFSS